MARLLEIFRGGRHVANDGTPVEFGARELDDVVTSYDPALHEAPMVIGHPTTNGPALGWIAKVRRSGNSIEAEPQQVDPAFAEDVRLGRWKKISSSFYRPDSPSNPKPGHWYLRHVGFLGAQPPAVKGLRAVELAGGEDDFLIVEFAEYDVATLLRSLRDWILAKFGKEEADSALPGFYVDEAQADAATAMGPGFAEPKLRPQLERLRARLEAQRDVAFAEPKVAEALTALRAWLETQFGAEAAEAALPMTLIAPTDETTTETTEAGGAAGDQAAADLAERRRAKSPRELELERREARLAERERAHRQAEHASFCEALVASGRPLPARREDVIGLLEVLETATPSKDAAASFAEGERRTPARIFRDLLNRLPKQVEFGEVSGGGFSGDEHEDPSAVAARATAYQAEQQAKGIHVSTAAAVRAVKGVR